MKVPVVHVRGLILLFFLIGPTSNFTIPEDPSTMTFLCLDTFTRLSFDELAVPKAFRHPYKFLLRTVFCPLD